MQRQEPLIEDIQMVYYFVPWVWTTYSPLFNEKLDGQQKQGRKKIEEKIRKDINTEQIVERAQKIDKEYSKIAQIKTQGGVMEGPAIKSENQQLRKQEKRKNKKKGNRQNFQQNQGESKESDGENEDKKIIWSKNDDKILRQMISVVGKKWKYISEQLPNYNPKQIRERYLNHIRSHISHQKWTPQEDNFLMDLIEKYGYKWKFFEGKIKNRSQNQIKNRFYGHLTKKFQNKIQQKMKRANQDQLVKLEQQDN